MQNQNGSGRHESWSEHFICKSKINQRILIFQYFYKVILSNVPYNKTYKMTLQTTLSKPNSTGLFWGIIGGFSLIITSILFTKGLLQIAPYPLILVAALLTLKLNIKTDKSFNKFFTTGFLTFIIMSFILYIYLILFINPNSGITLFGHLWRIGAIIAFGIASALILSFIFSLKK